MKRCERVNDTARLRNRHSTIEDHNSVKIPKNVGFGTISTSTKLRLSEKQDLPFVLCGFHVSARYVRNGFCNTNPANTRRGDVPSGKSETARMHVCSFFSAKRA